jgi:hypothetical protein
MTRAKVPADESTAHRQTAGPEEVLAARVRVVVESIPFALPSLRTRADFSRLVHDD